ncbi:MAG: hypothetical protein QW478_07690 [Candidatus Micrarchaeaceae archaeon]
MNLFKVRKSKQYYITSNKSLFFVEYKLREFLEKYQKMHKEINPKAIKYTDGKLTLYYINSHDDNIFIYFFYNQFEGTTEIRIYNSDIRDYGDQFDINIIKDILKKLQKSKIEFMPYSS